MTNESEQMYVIFDTDMGCDDAWALQMLLKAEKYQKNVKLLAITTVFGNSTTENVIKNTYRILDGANRTDVPIYKGATEPIIPEKTKFGYFYGCNGFADIDIWLPHYPKDVNMVVQLKHAVRIIGDLILKYPNKISLVCLGPLTNIALAIKTNPEIREMIKEVFIMCGNIKGVGNATSYAEFNFHMDPEAASIVLNSLSCPLTIVPWECCIDEKCFISLDWRFKAFKNISNANVRLLNQAEYIVYRDCDVNLPPDKYTPCDAILTAVFLFPKCIKRQETRQATVELHGHLTRGQMILDPDRRKDYNVTIVQTIHVEKIKKILLWTAGGDKQLEL